MQVGTSPRVVSSSRRIKYRASAWRVEQFEVLGAGELVCRGAALWLHESLLVWVGGAEPRLAEVALGVPAGGGASLATPLTGDDGGALSLARRLAAALTRPVYVCCGSTFDRFTAPLVEHALLAMIKRKEDSS